MYLVGFIIRIYHDARSSECQICIINLRFPFQITMTTTRFHLSDRHQADFLLAPAVRLPLAPLVLLLKAALGSSPGSSVGSCYTVATADHKVHRVLVNDRLMTTEL